MSKVAGENWSNYCFNRYGLDIRSVRFPGIIGHSSLPGGGTTDYAVDIFYSALKGEEYTCFLKPDTRLPMMYMDDAIRATTELMAAPKEIASEIQKHIPNFTVKYEPDFRQEIADSWSESIDDSHARSDWNWQHKYDLANLVQDMLAKVDVNRMK